MPVTRQDLEAELQRRKKLKVLQDELDRRAAQPPASNEPGFLDYVPLANIGPDIRDIVTQGWNSPPIQARRERREEAAKSMVPLAAAAAGGAVGSIPYAGAGLAARIAGAGAGTALGDAGGQAATQGGQIDPRQVASSAVAGAAGQGLGELAGAALPGLAKRFMRGGNQQAAQATIDDAARFGATPTVAQASGNVRMPTIENSLANIPGGSGRLRKAAEKATTAVQAQLTKLATEGGEVGSEKAGLALTKGIQGFVDDFHFRAQPLFQQITKEVGPGTMVPAARTVDTLGELSSRIPGAERTGQALSSPFVQKLATNFTDDVAEAGGQVPFEALQAIRTSVGEKLGQPGLQTDVTTGQLKKLYAALSDDIKAAAQQAGPDALKAFNRANTFYRAGSARIEDTLAPLMRSRTPEKAFKALMSGSKDGPSAIRTVFRSLTEEQQRAITGTVIKRLGTATPGQQGAEGATFSFQHFLTEWNKIDKGARDVMFNRGSHPNFGNDLEALARYAEKVVSSSKAFANPSGTTGSTLSTGMSVAAAGGAALSPFIGSGALALPLVIGGGVTASNMAARLVTSPAVVKWMAQATRLNPSGIPAHLTKLAMISESQDPATQAAIAEYLSMIQAQGGQ